MSRKKTILTAALINAALLAALMITALSDHEEESLLTPASVVLEKEEITLPNVVQIEQKNSQPLAHSESKGENIVHKLPEVVAQKQSSEEISSKSSTIQSVPSKTQEAKIESSLPQVALNRGVSKGSFKEIIVKKGDSLDKLAKQHHTTVDEILVLNHLSGSLIRTGQVLKVPTTEKKSTTGKMYYIVKPGDNPWTIAMKHHIKLEDLLRLNNLDKQKAKKLRPGDRLRIR